MERILPYLVLLLCPLMHLVMMRTMKGGKGCCPEKERQDT
jgi:hypothetical protein